MIFARAVLSAHIIVRLALAQPDRPPVPPPPEFAPSEPTGEAKKVRIWQKNSFRAPFDTFEQHSGDRSVNQYWSVGGDTKVNTNYVRLTNDRQNKRGWLYNTEPIKARDFSIQVKFRVSGQGQSLFGDGFVLWVVQNRITEWSKSGDFFAGPRGFNGFAIVFDTYKNAEMAGTHKDVYLLTNDGNAQLDIHTPKAGCTSNYRWFEKRDDFSVQDYALARVSYNSGSNRISVEIDGANTDRFVECFETEMPHGQFMAGAHIALSATTGQLADNHDILAVDTASYGVVLPHDDDFKSGLFKRLAVLESKIQQAPGGADVLSAMRLWRVEQEKRLNHLHHQFEHEVEFMRDSMRHMINQIRDAEKDDSNRIEKLERAAAEAAKQAAEANVVLAIESAKADLNARRQRDLHAARDQTIQDMRNFEANIKDNIHAKVQEAKGSGDDTFWKISSIFLLVMILIVVIIAYRKYKQIYDHGHLP